MIWNFVPTARILGITAWRMGLYFVLLDIMWVMALDDISCTPLTCQSAFVIQVYGAASAATATNTDDNSVTLQGITLLVLSPWRSSYELSGLHIYMAGVGIQQLFILIFTFFAAQIHRAILNGKQLDGSTRSKALLLLYTLYAVLALITVCKTTVPFFFATLTFFPPRSASSFASSNTHKGSTALLPIMRLISTA